MIKIIFSVEGKCEPSKPSKVYFSRIVESPCYDVPYSSIINALHYLFSDISHNVVIKVSEL